MRHVQQVLAMFGSALIQLAIARDQGSETRQDRRVDGPFPSS
jgi:hypothetical protein